MYDAIVNCESLFVFVHLRKSIFNVICLYRSIGVYMCVCISLQLLNMFNIFIHNRICHEFVSIYAYVCVSECVCVCKCFVAIKCQVNKNETRIPFNILYGMAHTLIICIAIWLYISELLYFVVFYILHTDTQNTHSKFLMQQSIW